MSLKFQKQICPQKHKTQSNLKTHRTKNLLLTAVLTFLAATTAAGRTVTISAETLKDKIRGAWAGQAIGCDLRGHA